MQSTFSAKHRILLTSIFLSATLSWPACKQDPKEAEKTYTDFEDCKYGSPKPLFNDKMPQIRKHYFKPEKTFSSEQIIFTNGVALEMIQAGCHKARQEFRFLLRGDFSTRDEKTWISATSGLFKYLSTIDPSLLPFLDWSKAINEKSKLIHLGSPLEVQPGFLVTIDRIVSPDLTTLVVVFMEL